MKDLYKYRVRTIILGMFLALWQMISIRYTENIWWTLFVGIMFIGNINFGILLERYKKKNTDE